MAQARPMHLQPRQFWATNFTVVIYCKLYKILTKASEMEMDGMT